MSPSFESTRSAVEFSLRLFGLLRRDGVTLSTLQTTACVEAMTRTGVTDTAGLLAFYRITLINRKEDLPRLQRIFAALLDVYFAESPDAQDPDDEPERARVLTMQHEIRMGEAETDGDADDSADSEAYSTHDIDHHKDFRLMPKADYPAVLKALETIARRHAALTRRKTKRSRNGGVVDLRSSVRQSVRFDGEIFDWRYRRKTPTHTRLVVVVDVSGSMEVYSVFLLNFLHLLNQNHRLKVEVFVFSTELQPLTKYFRLRNFRSMLDNISLHFSGWSGGTKIGQAIASLNENYAASLTPKTLVTIMSDGWDTGDIELLDREMARLSSRVKAIVWINPLKGDPGYEPLAMGMAAARPYCDEFVSGHSIDTLEAFTQILDR